VYAALAGIVEAAGSSAAARELFKGDGKTVSRGNTAAITALLAGEGRTDLAVELLASVVAAQPARPWAASAGVDVRVPLAPGSARPPRTGVPPSADRSRPPRTEPTPVRRTGDVHRRAGQTRPV
jgi:hypothetical protein